uniref:Secreted protein n=1 Tax=Heterorhabditis bacteriophora TaxID=37862 RepID=A0A1I7WZB8_HETBA
MVGIYIYIYICSRLHFFFNSLNCSSCVVLLKDSRTMSMLMMKDPTDVNLAFALFNDSIRPSMLLEFCITRLTSSAQPIEEGRRTVTDSFIFEYYICFQKNRSIYFNNCSSCSENLMDSAGILTLSSSVNSSVYSVFRFTTNKLYIMLSRTNM